MPLFDTIRVANQTVKIYTVTNRGNPFLKLSYLWEGQWKQRLIRRFGPEDDKRARAAARDIAAAMSQGRADQIHDFTLGWLVVVDHHKCLGDTFLLVPGSVLA